MKPEQNLPEQRSASRRWEGLLPLALSLGCTAVAMTVVLSYQRWRRQQLPGKPQAALPEFLAFPQGFVWGAATSAYQVEGGISNDWSAAGMDAGAAAEHYQHFRKDFEIAASLGQNAHRLSIEWSRIAPTPDSWDEAALDHYQQVFESLNRLGLRPCVTLWHFTQPQWFVERGGWLKEENVWHFVDYVRKLVRRFADEVDWWVTLNEPMVYAFHAHHEGLWPPFHKSLSEAFEVARNLLLAHARAYKAIKEISPEAEVGLVKNFTLLDPLRNWHPAHRLRARISHQLFNQAYLQAFESGEFELRAPGAHVKLGASAGLKGSLDFLGINYYTRFYIDSKGSLHTRSAAPTTEMDWEVYPDGLLRVLESCRTFSKNLKIPLYITENGIADASDKARRAFLHSHLLQLWQAIQSGIDVRGYFYWSLIDNFEWAEGFERHFGLMDRQREIRDSALYYKEIADNNGLESVLPSV